MLPLHFNQRQNTIWGGGGDPDEQSYTVPNMRYNRALVFPAISAGLCVSQITVKHAIGRYH